ncbi:MAG TPA: hypothetical protein DGD08_15750 [Gemmatimonas aurantiaca]|uniref:Uncharacterized protein n=1 Tax=Gemmatimonas aurantiaca TaxID=173480 RepID=A0A3D4VC09_9BACT|nr:M66 family metalloprotease [Gemmatimonas aurantiaca]HCT58659.1 hypothetical protein [Gemmatimonas aurantiaca]
MTGAEGTWQPAVSDQTIAIENTGRPQSIIIVFDLLLRRALLIIDVAGLPAGANANVNAVGPGNNSFAIVRTDSLNNAELGDWFVNAEPVVVGGKMYLPTPATQMRSVRAREAVRIAVRYQVSTGSLAVAVLGLPAGTNGNVTVSGPNGFTRSLTGTTTLTDLDVGTYQVTAAPVTPGGISYAPTPSTTSVQVTTSAVAAGATISYAATAAPTGSLAVNLSGLPAGQAGQVTITGPNNYSRVITATSAIAGLTPGSYTVTAARVRGAAGTYNGSPASQVLNVLSAQSASAAVSYAALPAVVQLPVSGLPAGTNASVSLTAPSGATTSHTSSTVISNAAAGRWRLTASAVVVGGFTYAPSPASYDQTVLAGDTLEFPVSYALSTGAIAVTIGGLPAGVTGTVTVTGPNGFSRQLQTTTTLTGLTPGNYTIAAPSVSAGGLTYLPSPASRTVTVSASLVAQAASVTYASQSGSVALTVTGLPAGAAADLTLTGPNGYSETLSAGGTIGSVPPGTYTLTVGTVRTALGTYAAAQATRSVTVTANATASQTVAYAALPASVVVPVAGLPAGTNPSFALISPSGVTSQLTTAYSNNSAATGRWRVTANAVQSGGHGYAASPASYDKTVLAGDTLEMPVTYSLSTGAIAVSVGGLPVGNNAAVTITGPNSYSRSVSATETVTNLAPGTYTVSAASVVVSGTSYTPSPATRQVTVSASLVAQAAAVTYASQSGSLALTVSGLPTGAVGDMTLTGPNSYSRAFTATSTISGLAAGSYTLTVRNVRTAAGTYAATPLSRAVTITTGGTSSQTVAYAALPAVVSVPVTGVPGGSTPSITLTSPTGATTTVTATTTISAAAAGRWRLAASVLSSGGNNYSPSPASYDQTVLAGDTLEFPVAFALSSGGIAVSATGLPAGVNANVTVTGPSSFTRALLGTLTLTSLVPGSYTVTAAAVTSGGITYNPTPTSRALTVTASAVAQAASVVYAAQIGRLTINASGLPTGAAPVFTLSGTASRSVTGARTVDSLAPGNYTVTAASVTVNGTTYAPSTTSAAATVSAGGTATTSFTYAAQGSRPENQPESGGGGGGNVTNLSIENVYVTQATQNWEGTAPIVIGREALARVFVKAAATNTVRPDVRLRIYANGSLVSTVTIPATASAVPTTISEGTMSASWNVVIPAANVRAGMQVLADVDPNNALGESDRTDNTWPRGGTLKAVTTVNPAVLEVKFVPVTVAGLTGNVSESNKASWLEMVKLIHPVRDVQASVRATFVSNAPALQSNNGNGAWLTVLNEINVLRALDGNMTAHYYGVVKTNYSSGSAGFGNQPGKAAVGWDEASTYQRIFAHEIGHNFGLGHAPCGVSGSAAYPYAGGVIGAWGWNAKTNTLVAPTVTDVMGYCSSQWVSDWTWSRVAQWRGTAGRVISAATSEGMLIWGRSENGVVTLEPAFAVSARGTPESSSATHEADLYDEYGSLVASHSFAMESIDHAAGDQQFAVVVPLSEAQRERVVRIVVRSTRSPMVLAAQRSARSALAAVRDSSGQQLSDARTLSRMESIGSGRRRVNWNQSTFRMGMVRDRNTGEVLSFLRRSGDEFRADGRSVEIVFSDGTRSVVERD